MSEAVTSFPEVHIAPAFRALVTDIIESRKYDGSLYSWIENIPKGYRRGRRFRENALKLVQTWSNMNFIDFAPPTLQNQSFLLVQRLGSFLIQEVPSQDSSEAPILETAQEIFRNSFGEAILFGKTGQLTRQTMRNTLPSFSKHKNYLQNVFDLAEQSGKLLKFASEQNFDLLRPQLYAQFMENMLVRAHQLELRKLPLPYQLPAKA